MECFLFVFSSFSNFNILLYQLFLLFRFFLSFFLGILPQCCIYLNQAFSILDLEQQNTYDATNTKNGSGKGITSQYNCDVCDVLLNSQLQLSQHLDSPRHKANKDFKTSGRGRGLNLQYYLMGVIFDLFEVKILGRGNNMG